MKYSQFHQPAKRIVAMLMIGIALSSSCKKQTSNEEPVSLPKLSLNVITSSPEGFLVNSALISGEKDMILIDAQFTIKDAEKVVAAIRESKKNLTTIYITHGHPDHYFGLNQFKSAFPNARIVALHSTVKEINRTWKEKLAQWKPGYGDLITSAPIIPDALSGTTLNLEGHTLQISGDLQGDMSTSSYVWIPSLKTVVAGDIVYNGVFPWTVETNPAERTKWSSTLDQIATLRADIVVSGHKNPILGDTPAALGFTKEYLNFYDITLPTTKTSQEFQSKMKAQYPTLILDVSLQIAADAFFK